MASVLGLYTSMDGAANLVMSSDGSNLGKGIVAIGSHLDSVPSGGNFDGLAGVVAALLMVYKAKQRGYTAKPLVGLGLRGEESAWFGVPYIGAKALFGKLTQDDLARLQARIEPTWTLYEAMQNRGAAVAKIAAGEVLTPPSDFREFWELHIEQGPLLVSSHNFPIGIVTGIRGNVRAPNAYVMGQAGHSGTTPHHLRNDAVLRFAELICALEERRLDVRDPPNPRDVLVTCGVVHTDMQHSALTSIADRVDFTLDIRSMVDEHADEMLRFAQAYSGRHVDWGQTVKTPSAVLDSGLIDRGLVAADKLRIRAHKMPSGAGHDAAVFQQNGVPSGMIFIRNLHGSHNPHEAMDLDDFMLGVEVLWEAITEGSG
jgi:beta-ureidopropionase / N-carbamoyl-L-amino-acid hydrolase